MDLRLPELVLPKLLALVLMLCWGAVQVRAQNHQDPVQLAETFMDNKEWSGAISILEQVYADPPADLDDFELSNVISNLGLSYWETGDLLNARKLLAEAITIKRDRDYIYDIDYTRTLQNLARVLQELGQYDHAKILFEEAISTIGENHREDQYAYATALSNLASLYYVLGSYYDALDQYQTAHDIIRASFGENSPEYAEIAVSMGRIFMKTGSFNEAENYLKKSILIYKNLDDEHQIEYAEAMASLGGLYEMQGKYADSEKVLLTTLAIKEEIQGLDKKLLIETLNDLGILYHQLGNLEKAERFFSRVRTICQGSLGKEDSRYAVSINNLATIAKQKQEFGKAKKLFEESLDICNRIYGKEHPLYADGLNNLASVESELNLNDLAESHYLEGLRLDKEIYGENHPHYATTLNNYGILLFKKGEMDQAEQAYLQALKIRKQALGLNHPTYARSLENIGLYYYARHKMEEAEKYFREAINIQKKQIRTIFPVLTEKERKVFYETISMDIERYNHIAASLLDKRPELIEYILNNQIQTKAILLTASKKVRKSIMSSGDQQLIKDYENWKSLKTRLVQYYYVGADRLAEHGINIAELEEEIDQIEKRIIQARGSFEEIPDTDIQWLDIKNSLNPGEAAIEILRIREFDQDLIDKRLVFGFNGHFEYVAIIIDPRKTNPVYVRLENGNLLEGSQYNYYKNCLQYKLDDQKSYYFFWDEIHKHLDDISHVYVSPDGIYHKINPNIFKTPDGDYLIDHYFVSYITNCSDLLPRSDAYSGQKTYLRRAYLIGDPEFRVGGDGAFLNQLPGSLKEVDMIGDILNKKKNWEIHTYTEDRATEFMLKSSYRPNLLHIATHGFFAIDDAIASNLVPEGSHPMFRSGIYLAGVENTLLSYYAGQRNDPFNDGVLTAYEAMNLDLDKTDIVILSACNTGLGEVVNGEGVFGLQRAFIVAGAANLIISLTKVDDRVTQKLMTYFYEYYQMDDHAIDEALRKSQLKLREEYHHPLYWGSFMLVGKGSSI